MKTTIDLPEHVLMDAKKKAIERRTTLRELVLRGLRHELAQQNQTRKTARAFDWKGITVKGGLHPGVDISSREKMYDVIGRKIDLG